MPVCVTHPAGTLSHATSSLTGISSHTGRSSSTYPSSGSSSGTPSLRARSVFTGISSYTGPSTASSSTTATSIAAPSITGLPSLPPSPEGTEEELEEEAEEEVEEVDTAIDGDTWMDDGHGWVDNGHSWLDDGGDHLTEAMDLDNLTQATVPTEVEQEEQRTSWLVQQLGQMEEEEAREGVMRLREMALAAEQDRQEGEAARVNAQPPINMEMVLPFRTEYVQLTGLSAESEPIASLEPQPVDVDRWELVLSPAEYLVRFKDSLSTVLLVNQAQIRTLHTGKNRGPKFNTWLLLARATQEIWMDPTFKEPFFEALARYQTSQPGHLPLQASLGQAHIATSIFVHCLQQAGCDTVKVKAYGQKTPLLPRFIVKEPAQIDHRWAEYNEWDIGRTFHSDKIWIFASATGRTRGIRHYPAMQPAAVGFGTVNIDALHNNRKFEIKVYPRMVHVIKSFNSGLQSKIPSTLKGVKLQVASALRMIHNLSSKEPKALGGFRIEVTVRAPSLAQAEAIVKGTRFFEPGYWLGYGEGPHHPRLLAATTVTKQGLLENAQYVYDKADTSKVFVGTDGDAPTALQLQAAVDIFNALGWNKGLRKATSGTEEDAWYYHTPSTERAQIFQKLSAKYTTDDDMLAMFEAARSSSHPYAVPCKAHPGNPDHRYQINARSPFRVRCSKKECWHKLQRTALVMWLAELIHQGLMDGTALGIGNEI